MSRTTIHSDPADAVAGIVDAGQIDPEAVVTPGIYVDRVLDLSTMPGAGKEAS